MAHSDPGRRRVQFHLCKGHILVKIALIAVLVLSVAALVMLQGALRQTQAQTEGLRAEAAALEQDNSKLRRDLDDLGTVEGIIRLAKEKLGLAEPDTVIIEPENEIGGSK